MATHPRTVRRETFISRDGGPEPDGSVRELIKQLGTEGSDLLRSELALAKLEMRDMAREMAMASARLGAAVAVATIGVLAIVTWMILGLADILGGNHGTAALIVGAVFLIVGALMARSGARALKPDRPMARTRQSVHQTQDWARHEAQEFKDEIRS